MGDWVAGAERIGCQRAGGSFDGSPFRFVVHTVEGDPATVAQCRSLAEGHSSPPQLWYSPKLDWLGQGLPLSRSGYALAHVVGDRETNKAGAIQVEVFGFARDTPGWPGAWLDALGRRVLGGVIAAGVPINRGQLAATTGSDGYGRRGAVRMDWGTWAGWNGLCVHANVPGNDHWDAGAIDLARIARAAGAPPARRDFDMTPGQCRDKTGRKWFFVVGDDLTCYASVSGGAWFAVGGKWTAGLDAMCEHSDDPRIDGLLVVAGRGIDGHLYQMLVYTDGGPPPPGGRTVIVNDLGGHIYPGKT